MHKTWQQFPYRAVGFRCCVLKLMKYCGFSYRDGWANKLYSKCGLTLLSSPQNSLHPSLGSKINILRKILITTETVPPALSLLLDGSTLAATTMYLRKLRYRGRGGNAAASWPQKLIAIVILQQWCCFWKCILREATKHTQKVIRVGEINKSFAVSCNFELG